MHHPFGGLHMGQGKGMDQRGFLDRPRGLIGAGIVMPIDGLLRRNQAQQCIGAVGTVIGVDGDPVEPQRKMMRQPFHQKQRLVPHAGDDHMCHAFSFAVWGGA